MELASKISRKIRDILGTFLYTILEKIRDRPRQKNPMILIKNIKCIVMIEEVRLRVKSRRRRPRCTRFMLPILTQWTVLCLLLFGIE